METPDFEQGSVYFKQLGYERGDADYVRRLSSKGLLKIIMMKREIAHDYKLIQYILMILLYFLQFPTYSKSAADDFENMVTKTCKNLHKR